MSACDWSRSQIPRATKNVRFRIQSYTEEWNRAVAEFNRRVLPANAPFQVPETPAPLWLPKRGDQKPYQEVFLMVEDDCVRGAYTFKHQEFSVGRCVLEVGMCRMPISEGVVDKRYSMVGPMLIKDALRRQPMLYGLGIGNLEVVVARIVLSMGWRVIRVVPFFFKVRNGFQFLRNIQYLRTTRLRQWLLDAAAYTGLGWAGTRIADAVLTRNGHRAVTVEQVGEFSAWADGVWQTCQSQYSMAAVRDARVLNILYPPDDIRFIRLKILDGRHVAGWAVLLDTVMADDKYFGNMRVGSIVDCLALPEDANTVMYAAARFLEDRGVDLLLSNQNHPAWCEGLKMAGFVEGPSNFFFVASKALSKLLNEIDPAGTAIHLNRGDGDGPIHL